MDDWLSWCRSDPVARAVPATAGAVLIQLIVIEIEMLINRNRSIQLIEIEIVIEILEKIEIEL